jgi:lipopolysaccharide export system protein LptA
MYRRRLNKTLFLIMSAVLLPAFAAALPSDGNQPMNISSEKTDVNYATSVAINTGNVVVDQGTSHASGDEMTTYRDSVTHKIKETILKGNLAHYNTVVEADKPPLNTSAKVITYFPEKQYVVLDGDAVATRGADSVTADKIIYNMATKKMTAESTDASKQTHIVLVNDKPK